jgi:hypothetical protein
VEDIRNCPEIQIGDSRGRRRVAASNRIRDGEPSVIGSNNCEVDRSIIPSRGKNNAPLGVQRSYTARRQPSVDSYDSSARGLRRSNSRQVRRCQGSNEYVGECHAVLFYRPLVIQLYVRKLAVHLGAYFSFQLGMKLTGSSQRIPSVILVIDRKGTIWTRKIRGRQPVSFLTCQIGHG